ncbi:Dolichyl-phosphate-mannose-protein mannosyltransferase [Kaistia soli DSM 19436]|uniref:Dolichyl-phosphate-mannose-protein mannosyltransferase n=1 Tax=Kaistia soli DSM 19436 TaxID=1122133 RepID=A0A1M5MD63_9HYPH|nr:glycosyltransferase family 39 protein [Kaistia soli]SHG74683.1 Dolichyl-phosphate-mannose-protein mannosyltransferase [Kaistia soli DSM 19436]
MDGSPGLQAGSRAIRAAQRERADPNGQESLAGSAGIWTTGRRWPLGVELAIFLSAALLVLAVLLPTLGRLALWYDEVLTADVAEASWGELIRDRLANGHFPSYFALIKILGLGAANEFWLRLPSALFSAGAAGLLAIIALRFIGAFAAVATVLLYVTLPILIAYGQEARPYTMMLFFVVLAMLGHLSMLTRQSGVKRYAWAATVGTVGAALTIPAGIVAVAMLQAGALACGALRESTEKRLLWRRHFLATSVVTLVAMMGLVPGFISLGGKAEGLMKWQVATSAANRFLDSYRPIYGFAVDYDANHFLPASYETWLGAALLALIAAGALLGISRTVGRYLIVTAIGTPLVFIIIGSFTAVTPRYMLGMMPATILLVAAAMTFLVSRPAWRIPGAALLAIFFLAISLQAADMLVSERKLDWRSVAAFLRANGISDTEILANSDQTPRDLAHYLPKSDGITYQFVRPPLEPMDRIWSAAKARDVAWIATLYADWLPPDVTADRTVCRWRFSALTLFAVARDPSLLPPSLRNCATATQTTE